MLNSLRLKAFWVATTERAVKTFAQALLAVFVAGQGFDFFAVNWPEALGTALTATVISVLTSVASANVGPEHSPSLVAAPPATPPSPNVLPEMGFKDGQ